MDDEKRLKAAKDALFEIKLKEIEKKMSLYDYRHAQQLSKEWKLPFRLIYEKEYACLQEVPPNEFYPAPGELKIDERVAAKLDNIFMQLVDDQAQDVLTAEEKQVLDGYQKRQAMQKHLNAENVEYYLTRFLQYAHMDDYSNTDWTGDLISDQDAARLKEMYSQRLADFHESQHLYYTNDNPRKAAHTKCYIIYGAADYMNVPDLKNISER